MLAMLRAAGLSLRADGQALHVEPRSALTDDLRETIRANKNAILRELSAEAPPLTPEQEAARRNVLARLAANPGIRRAFVNRWEGDVMILTLAVRDIGTCELAIPRERFGSNSLADYNVLADCFLNAERPA